MKALYSMDKHTPASKKVTNSASRHNFGLALFRVQ